MQPCLQWIFGLKQHGTGSSSTLLQALTAQCVYLPFLRAALFKFILSWVKTAIKYFELSSYYVGPSLFPHSHQIRDIGYACAHGCNDCAFHFVFFENLSCHEEYQQRSLRWSSLDIYNFSCKVIYGLECWKIKRLFVDCQRNVDATKYNDPLRCIGWHTIGILLSFTLVYKQNRE